MGKFEGILICTDLDGTLLRSDKSISKENHDAIEYFKREGGYFTFITGRMPCSSRSLYNVIKPNAPVGCINGGGIYDFENDKYLWSQTLSYDVIELVEYAINEIPSIGVQINSLEKIYFCRENIAMERFRFLTGTPNLVIDCRSFHEPIAKILFGDVDSEKISRLAGLLNNHPKSGEFDYIHSERMLYEILPKGSSKGNLLVRLAEILGVEMARTVAIGDYNNDVSMIRKAGVGIAVANAVDEAKASADRITVSNEEHAIAKIISEIDSGELKI